MDSEFCFVFAWTVLYLIYLFPLKGIKASFSRSSSRSIIFWPSAAPTIRKINLISFPVPYFSTTLLTTNTTSKFIMFFNVLKTMLVAFVAMHSLADAQGPAQNPCEGATQYLWCAFYSFPEIGIVPLFCKYHFLKATCFRSKDRC
jgi:hypothetical protein